ncbi:hypothetical protein [Pararhizobium arenae]|uniref:hypothetical protein n=1 Tax=Pararhizobium arenae TaxID=1856850 RepID=UPI00094B5062|nr:hypothetical protein [Pararhizobium arenae]
MKRHLLTSAGGIGAIGLTALILLAGNAAIRGVEDTATPEFTLDTPTMEELAPDDAQQDDAAADPVLPDPEGGIESPAVEAKPLRSIEPDAFAAPDTQTGEPLERVEARAPLSQPASRPEPKPQVLRHPIAISAGSIRFDNGVVQLEGIEPQSADRQCGTGAAMWPCGIVARTAFRNYLRARALTCTVPGTTWQGTVNARCSIGNDDPARWLADNGWAEATANSPLSRNIEVAKAGNRGFYGNDPRQQKIEPGERAEPFDMAPETAQ